MGGKKIVLAASDSESNEYLHSTWRQMLLATLPARYARYMGIGWSLKNEVAPDGQARYAVGQSVNRHEDSSHPEKRYANLFIGLETGSPRLFNQYMKGKAYPYRANQWPEVVLKGMEILNKHNWFPFCTFILGLPGETREDTKLSLDLLFALKDAKWFVIPTLFVPLEDTRLEKTAGAKLVELTDLQWEFFFTCWRYNVDFFRRSPADQWRLNLGIPLYYYLLGRRLFGKEIKYALLRLVHFPEQFLQGKLYLDFSGKMAPGYRVPGRVEIPQTLQPLPELD